MPGAPTSSYYMAGQPGNKDWLAHGPNSDEKLDANGYINLWDAQHQNYMNTGRQDAGWLDNQRRTQIDAENSRRTAARDASMEALRAQIMQAAGGGAYSAGTGAVPLDTTPYDRSADAAASASLYAGAKDRVGAQTRGATRGLQNTLARRGLVGSGQENEGYASIYQQGQSDLTSVLRQDTQDRAGAERQYYGDQRGRNQQAQEFNITADDRRRQAASDAATQRLQMLLSASSSY